MILLDKTLLRNRWDNSQGLAAITRKANPFLNIVYAVLAVIARPAPIYLKLSFKYDLSAVDKASLVSLFKSAFTPMAPPIMTAYKIMGTSV